MVPHSGRESSKKAAPLFETAHVHQAGQRRRLLGSIYPNAVRSGFVSGADQDAGFMTAPSGTSPCVANRHKAISNLRASATTITFRMRRPVPLMRSRNHLTWAESGWCRSGLKPQYALRDPALVGRDVHFVEKRFQERRIASDMIIGADDRHRRIVIDYKQRPAALSSDLHGVLGEFSPAAATLVRPDPKDEFREPRWGAPGSTANCSNWASLSRSPRFRSR
jgi:hypothetical protein